MLSFKINFAFSIKNIYICSIFMNISRKFIFFGNHVNVKENLPNLCTIGLNMNFKSLVLELMIL